MPASLPPVAAPRRLGIGAALASAWVAASLAPGCRAASSDVDGADLLGVFEGGAGSREPGAGTGKEARPGARGGARGRGGDPATTTARLASAGQATRGPAGRGGACVESAAEPALDLRRTVGRPACVGARVLEWRDPAGSPRYACVRAPHRAEGQGPLPAVVFFHDAHADPSFSDKGTGLRKRASAFALGGDPARPGFAIVAVQGRALRGDEGTTFDVANAGPGNVDLVTVDHFLDVLASEGLVDGRRVFTLGAGKGGAMAAFYAMARPDRIAAFAAFAAEAPPPRWICREPPPPGLLLYRACDAVAPCEAVERFVRTRDAQGAETRALRLGLANEAAPHCEIKNRCSKKKGETAHARWPRAKEDEVLRFFARHPLPGP